MSHSAAGSAAPPIRLALVWTAALALLGGCANADAALQRETARIVGGVGPSDVQLSDVKRGVTTVEWTASTPKGQYACTSDDMLRQPLCVPAN